MATSPKLGLVVPSTSDQFSTQDIADNWTKIDASPGNFICDSAHRPTWGTPQAGRKITETDTLLEWIWTGTAWRRTVASGLLRTSSGAAAIARRTTPATTSSDTNVLVVAVSNVVVPAGNRPLRVEAKYWAVSDATGGTYFSILQSAVANTGANLTYWDGNTGSGGAQGGGNTGWAILESGLAPGVYNFSLQFRNPGKGTSTVFGTAGSPITIAVTEL